MTPRTALAEVYGAIQADDILAALKRAGLVVVDKGAIGRAQREAVRQWEEDNREPLVNSTRLEWDRIRKSRKAIAAQ